MEALAVEWPRRTQIDVAPDAAFERGRLDRLTNFGPGDHFGWQDIERERPGAAVGRQDAAVERGDREIVAQPADADRLAFAAAVATDGDAGNVAKRLGDIAVGEFAQFLGRDRIDDCPGVALGFA